MPCYNAPMNTTTTARYTAARTTAAARFRFSMLGATPETHAAARAWYSDAARFCRVLAHGTGWTLPTAAAVVSAFSPRERWSTNKGKAMQYACGVTPAGLRSNVARADRCVRMGLDGLGNGPKIGAFARAMLGDADAVVIDSWMCRAAGLAKDSPTPTEYAAVADAVRELATEYGMRPVDMQALLWILVRGKAQ
jgi:hypothetical protein